MKLERLRERRWERKSIIIRREKERRKNDRRRKVNFKRKKVVRMWNVWTGTVRDWNWFSRTFTFKEPTFSRLLKITSFPTLSLSPSNSLPVPSHFTFICFPLSSTCSFHFHPFFSPLCLSQSNKGCCFSFLPHLCRQLSAPDEEAGTGPILNNVPLLGTHSQEEERGKEREREKGLLAAKGATSNSWKEKVRMRGKRKNESWRKNWIGKEKS